MPFFASTTAAVLKSLLLLPLFLNSVSLAQLSTSFYATSCPQAVSTITNTFVSLAKQDNVVSPSTLRLILHDCFVEGCDGSILISSTPGNQAERDAPVNQNLPQNAFDAIVAAKKAVEQICPGVVSCADILAVAARDSVVFLGGQSYEVPLGRLDGRISTAASVEGRIPSPNFNVEQLAANFASVGLSLEDMVVLSGAHTIGFTHCDQFTNRLYSFSSTVKVDPSMDPSFALLLEKKCPAAGSDNLVPLDFTSPFTFDSTYYTNLQAGKGVLFSDQVLFQDESTQSLVQTLAGSQSLFFSKFSNAMVKMCAIGVKQGTQGEVRTDCTKVNPGGGEESTPAALPPPSSPPPLNSPPPLVTASPAPPPPLEEAPPPPPSNGFTIPGIPGFLSPIHVPLPPRFRNRRPSPPPNSANGSPESSTEHV